MRVLIHRPLILLMVKRHFVLLAVFFTAFSVFDRKIYLYVTCVCLCDVILSFRNVYKRSWQIFNYYASFSNWIRIILPSIGSFFSYFSLDSTIWSSSIRFILFYFFHYAYSAIWNGVANFPSLFLVHFLQSYTAYVKYHSSVDDYFVVHFIWIADCWLFLILCFSSWRSR